MATILMIEDERPLREEVCDWLRFEGHQVISAENGRIGLEAAIRAAPDLIVCDITMPEMDGRTVLLEVRSNPKVSQTPFIFLTANATYEAIRQGMNLGADDYLTKPFKRADLLHAIESRLHRQKAQQQATQLQITAVTKAFREEQERRLLTARLVAMFSHDFRNPLVAILSSAELLETFGERMDSDRRRQYLHRIGGSVHLLLQMLDDMLTVAEMENGHLEYHPQALNVASFLADIVNEFRMIYDNSYHFAVETNFSEVSLTDPKLLRQIITNLLSNAVKYSSPGSTITVRLQPNAKAPAARKGFLVQVIDEGIGIPQEALAHLFDAFYRAENAKAQKGTGLGLAIVQEAVALCGGTIHVTSEVGKGSEFIVEFS